MAQSTRKKAPSRRADTIKVIVTLTLIIVVLSVASMVLWSVTPTDIANGETPFLSLESIVVEGETRYAHEQIVDVSGLYVGQSIFSVSKVEACENILKAFPYIESVNIENRSVSEVCITVKESTVMGAVHCGGQWLLVSTAGKGLEFMDVVGTRPPRCMYLRGVTPLVGAGIGKRVLDNRSFTVAKTLLQAFDYYKWTTVSEISLGDMTDIRFKLDGCTTVKLGSDGNLKQQMEVLSTAIPKLKGTYGDRLRGVVDASSYSRKGAKPQVIYTPQEVLDEQAENLEKSDVQD